MIPHNQDMSTTAAPETITITLADVACGLVGCERGRNAESQPLWLVLHDGRMVQVTGAELAAICRTPEGARVPAWQLTDTLDVEVRVLPVRAS